MRTLTDVYGVGEAAGSRRGVWAGADHDPAVPSPNQLHPSTVLPFRPARKLNHCRACGDTFAPRLTWHSLCAQCFHGAALYRALAKYREVSR